MITAAIEKSFLIDPLDQKLELSPDKHVIVGGWFGVIGKRSLNLSDGSKPSDRLRQENHHALEALLR